MNNSRKNTTRIAFIISALTLTLTLLGMSGHTARIRPNKEAARNSITIDSTSKELVTASNRVVDGMTSERGNAIGAQTYKWVGGHADGSWSHPENWDPEGPPGAGDTAILIHRPEQCGNQAQCTTSNLNRSIYLDGNIEVGTFIINFAPNEATPFILGSRVNDDGTSNTLTITDRFDWNGGKIRRLAKVETGEHSDVTITGGLLGENSAQAGFLTINGTGSISGSFTLAKGSALTVGSTATLTIESASPVVVDSEDSLVTLNILGTAIINGSGGIHVSNQSAINVKGTLDLRTDAALSSNCECEMNVSAGGTLVKSAGNGISSIGLKLNNAGTVSANSGTLAFSRSFSQSAGATILNGGDLSLTQRPLRLNGGILTGKGNVTGNVINGDPLASKCTVQGKVINPSIVQPGYPQSTVGQLTIAGDYTQGACGKLEIDIGGTVESRYDLLIVNQAVLSGTLDVSLINNFLPTCNESFDIVKYISRQGQFSVVNGIGLANGRGFTPDYASADKLRIVAHGFEGQDTDSDGVTDCVDADDDDDGDPDTTDCDPFDPARHSGATEVCDGLDNDCDGFIDDGVTLTFYRDADGDGFGNPTISTQSCAQPPSYVTNNTDCNDNDASVHSSQTYYRDADGDGFGDPNNSTSACSSSPPSGHVSNNSDCDDTKLLYANNDGDGFGAGQPVACGVANNSDCNDNDASVHSPRTYYLDADGDGLGHPNNSISVCSSTAPAGYVSNNTDCNDASAVSHPAATEVCDGLDNDCDGFIDDGVTLTFYRDADGDGFGNPTISTQSCAQPPSYVTNNTDCNDSNPSVHPSATEACNGLDDDCDSSIDEGWTNTDAEGLADCADTDDDNDGLADTSDNCPLIRNRDQANNDGDSAGDACDPDDDNDGGADITDCEPFIPTIHQFASEVCNGLDDDCDGAVDEGLLTTFYRDADGDGYGDASVILQRCTLPSGYVANNVDCNDSTTSVRPGATEACDGFDNDCDSSIDEGWTNTDADGQADCADTDDDNDGLADKADNCPLVANRNQADSNGDGIGDVCTVEIVFESYRDGNGEIYGMRSDGTGVVRLTNNAADDSDPTLSQDRTKIAFVSDRDGNREIYSMNLNNTGLMRLTTNDAPDVGPSWSPDGSMLVFTSLRDGNLEIYSMDATGGNPRNLTNNRRMDFEPDWGSNGKIAFVSNRDGPREIYSMDIDGSDVQRLTDNAVEDSHPSWAPPPNHNQIVFTSFRDGNSEIYVMKADGSGAQRQTINPAFDTSPAWGANGEIAFVSDRDGNFEIYSMIRNRRNSVRRLTNQRATDHGPDW